MSIVTTRVSKCISEYVLVDGTKSVRVANMGDDFFLLTLMTNLKTLDSYVFDLNSEKVYEIAVKMLISESMPVIYTV